MTQIENDHDLDAFAYPMNRVLGSCPTVWLPLSDEEKEGVWENTNTNSVSEFLKWADGQPNGERAQNYVAVDLENSYYLDFSAEATHCASCTSNTKASLTLRGLCKDSYLGEELCYGAMVLNKTYPFRFNIHGNS